MFRKASRELRYLSVVNWQLRQRCLPFLFAHINLCYKEEKLERLAKEVEIISGITKILVISYLHPSFEQDKNIRKILLQLKRLLHVEMKCDNINDNLSLLEAILALPTVTSVLVNHEPYQRQESMDNVDLSKVVLKQAHTSSDGCFTPHLEKCLSRGMKLALLELNERDLLDTKSQIGRTYSGLETVRFYMALLPFSWLDILS
ncbi:hypothetical protein F5880DRAFT_1593293 [Lentinula raphanica]|nr:hypothetical protein F5880DRAFT_1593293 [Lentinula raphanica]